MAKLSILAPFILSWEGGYTNHPADRGGPTFMGVTLSTWRRVGYDNDGDGDIDADDLRSLSQQQVVEQVLRPHYWDRCRADEIRSQSVANILVDWFWSSGTHAIKGVQKLTGQRQDGILGPQTLAAINNQNPKGLFDHLRRARMEFIERCAAGRGQSVFREGWLNRLSFIGYCQLTLNEVPPRTVMFDDIAAEPKPRTRKKTTPRNP